MTEGEQRSSHHAEGMADLFALAKEQGGEAGAPTYTRADAPDDLAGQAAAPVPGKTWGKYVIEKHMGRGGQAEVYQAYDRYGAAGHVALKVARQRVSARQAEAWTTAEAGPLVKLEHPNIVRVVDAGYTQGLPYVATRLVQGLPLDAYVKAHRPSARQIMAWIMQLADALAAAHAGGVVHRDIKPRNIVIPGDEKPKIIDFGISTLIDPYDVPAGAGTSGTPAFMAPEQARGDAEADHRVDIFALGAILKYLLDGQGPYGQADDALAAARTGQVEPADVRTGSSLRRALARIANRALAAEPQERYPNGGEMLRGLRRLKNRRKVLAATGAAALAAAATVAGAFLFRKRPPAPTAKLLVHFQRPGEGDAYHVLTERSRALKTGDRIQIHARLSRPLFAYVVSVDTRGAVHVLYPPDTKDVQPTTSVDLPPQGDVWFELEAPGGTETVLLLARAEPLGDLDELRTGLKGLGPPPKLAKAGLILADEEGVRVIERRTDPTRGISTHTVKATKGMLTSLVDAVPRRWALVRGVAFLHGSRGANAKGAP